MGSAQLDFVTPEEAPAPIPAPIEAPRPSALREQVAERLAAHRQRRERQGAADSTPSDTQLKSPRNKIAAAVAERYAHTPSYRAVLAEQAKRAIQEAAAAAEIAQRNAEAVAAAQQELLGELELWNVPQTFTPETAITIEKSSPKPAPSRSAGITVRLYEDLPPTPPLVPIASAKPVPRIAEPDAREAMALDAEIEFRQAPVWEEFWEEAEPNVPLPANLLEFPRQLVAARKARPRIAEGPLREEVTPRTAQLRIFEVEPEQIDTAPAPLPAAPEWTSSIRLDAHTVTEPVPTPETPVLASLLPPQTAPLQLRIMSAMVDGILVAAGALAFVAAYARAGGEIPVGIPAAISILGILTVVHVCYQLLFFTFSDETPGMRYARIGLCTFTDENPTRADMRRRILAQFVAVCPLGIGLLWILLDDDALGWHDRISRMYQRAY
jgi:uncharacterized RDD family membrane protein YckC